jgi:CBS domain-containing protein
MLVENILQTKGVVVHTLPETGTLADAVAMLNRHNIGAVVITDANGAIIGILSERDIVRRLGTDPAKVLSQSIASCMVRGVITSTLTTSVDEVMQRMTNFRIRHMPIVDGDKLVGIVSIGDVVKSRIEAAEQEANALRDYIAS